MLSVDLTGVLRTFRSCSPYLGEGGAMVAVSSIAGGVYGWEDHAHYAAAKAGVLGICRSLAVELAPRGIRVNAVIPGLIETPQSSDPVNSLGPEGLERAGGDIPWGRVGRPEEVADVIWFLTSGDSRYVTGQELVVDGGLIVKMRGMTGVLSGQTALVVGGASGIGRAIAAAFVDGGAQVVVLDRDPASSQEAASALGARGAVAADVTAEQEVVRAVAEAEQELGRIDVLVNSAGILTQSPLVEMSLAQWQQTIDVDLTGVFLLCRHVVPGMVERGFGRVINIASQLALKGGTSLTHYSAAKAGVIGLTKSLALEVARDGVLVNAIAPGPIETPLVDGISEDWKVAKRAELPLGRFGTPAEVAPTAVLLASSPGGDLYVGQTLGPNSGDVMP